MDAVFNWLWQGSVMTLALGILLRPLARARANVRYVVCWATMLLVIALPGVSWFAANTPVPHVRAVVPEVAVVSMPDAWWTSSAAMALAWAIWFGVHALRFAAALVAIRRARANSRPFPPDVEARLPHWLRVSCHGRRPALVLSDSVTAAAVLGCGRPTIAVAPSLLTALEPSELDRVLVHEWAHVRRRDDLVHVAQVAIRAVAGWHPAVWWLERRLHVEREVACDELTVAITGSPASYAACLVKLADARGAERTPLAAPAMLRAAGLRSRVTRIVSQRTLLAPAPARSLAALVVTVLAAAAMVVAALRLVAPSVLALPHVSIPVVENGFRSLVPEAWIGPPVASMAARVSRPSAAAVPVPTERTEPQLQASISAPAPQPPAVEQPAATDVRPTVPDPAPQPPEAPGVTEAGTLPPGPAPATAQPAQPPWKDVADGGVALGRKSKDAGVATAGAFTRFARRVAGAVH
jgi:beta-lactamase regulating signal transducer with metallopeptidase domain